MMRRLGTLAVLLLLPACGPGKGGTPAPVPAARPATAPASATAPRPAAPRKVVGTPEPTDLRTICCPQCAQASSRDPAGMDISMKACAAYRGAEFNGGPGVDDRCASYFQEERIHVRDCWEATQEH